MAAGGDSPEDRLGLGYKVGRTQQVRGNVDEVRMAKDRGARPHPGSGAGRIKDDASNEEKRFEFKSVAKTHSLSGAALLALFRRAVRGGQEAEYTVYFQEADITATITLTRGHPRG